MWECWECVFMLFFIIIVGEIVKVRIDFVFKILMGLLVSC